MILEGGTQLGTFWSNCKLRKTCVQPPYRRLLINTVLRMDYRRYTAASRSSIRGESRQVQEKRDSPTGELPVLRWMGDRTQPPVHGVQKDQTILKGGAKLGSF